MNDTKTTTPGISYRMGPAVLRIEGDHLVTRWAQETFAATAVADDTPPDATVRLVPDGVHPCGPGSGSGRIRVAEDAFSYQGRRFDIAVRRGDRDKLVAEFYPREHRHPVAAALRDPEEAWKLWLTHGAPLSLHLLKEFAYTEAPKISQTALLERDASLIHSSGIEVNGQGVLFAAWGGVGKSLLASRTVLHGSAKFLCDDHGVIDADGQMHLNLLPMHLYAYHSQDPKLRDRMLGSLSAGSRMQWAIGKRLKPGKAVRWVSPEAAFGPEKLGASVPINQVVVMFRGDADDFVWQPVSPAEAARSCVGVIFEEISGYADHLGMADAGWSPSILPPVREAYAKTAAVYERAFAHASPHRLLIPRKATPEALIEFLRKSSPLIDEAFAT